MTDFAVSVILKAYFLNLFSNWMQRFIYSYVLLSLKVETHVYRIIGPLISNVRKQQDEALAFVGPLIEEHLELAEEDRPVCIRKRNGRNTDGMNRMTS